MTQVSIGDSKSDVYFVYDGDCPICQIAAKELKIRKAVGKLHLIDARSDKENSVVKEVNAKGLNLDEGMVIKFNNTYYHGADALQVMALLGTNQSWFNRVNYLLFRSPILSKICYPFMRSARNFALKFKGVPKIDNICDKDQPTFRPIFGDSWSSLPPVMSKHYANRPYSNDIVTVKGKMDVKFNWFIKLMSPFLRLSGALVPYEGNDIPTIVRFKSEPHSNVFCFDREFRFVNKKPFHFNSRMIPQNGNEVIEFMRFGIGWKCKYSYDGKKVVLAHKGYVWKIFNINIPVPIGLLLGSGYAEEEALSDNSFKMKMVITHMLFGKMYEYKGTFKVVENE
ncbi:MAG: hypothetical protein COV35_07705 [Alphaproteobacteria bacterium CG11_big_fil_rev_8_21_14_0_20_39_49]|nr:MAG: hypothetical protein COV35_07705 [Alphaproteobacteria bacterium CG11_big_fil_rev_8_21_14_0_20_39_49]